MLQLAYNQAKELGDHHIGTEHILLGLAREGRGAAYRTLRRHGVDAARVFQAINQRAQTRDDSEQSEQESSETPTLDHFSRDLTQLARQGMLDPMIGRELAGAGDPSCAAPEQPVPHWRRWGRQIAIAEGGAAIAL